MKLKENPLTTALVGGSTTKLDSRIAFFGKTDELSCHLMKVRALVKEEELKEELVTIVSTLSSIMGEVAGSKFRLGEKEVEWMISLVKKYQENNGILTKFVIPGQNVVSADIHIARCKVREAELSYAKVYADHNGSDYIFEYLNKLSTLLFAIALKYE
jgi:ATP:cob(I)alamin adenosyltransferase